MPPRLSGSIVWDVGCGDDCEDSSGVFSGQEANQADLPGFAGIAEHGPQGDPIRCDGALLRADDPATAEDWALDRQARRDAGSKRAQTQVREADPDQDLRGTQSGSKRRVWRKIHIGIDEETLEFRAVEITSSNIGDAPMLPELLSQIPPDQDIGSVTADGAYDTRKCHEAIAARDAHAVIPPRKNAKPWKPASAGAVARNDAVNAQRYLGRTVWRRWSGYHRRSRVETKMHCMKLHGNR